MGNDASIPEQPLGSSTPPHSQTKNRMPASRSVRRERHVAARTSGEVGGFVDPVLAAAAAGAAAKRARQERQRPSPSPITPSTLFTVDNEWKASLHRFAKTAAETARTVASVAEPALSEAVQTARTSSAMKTPKQKHETDYKIIEDEKGDSKKEKLQDPQEAAAINKDESKGYVYETPKKASAAPSEAPGVNSGIHDEDSSATDHSGRDYEMPLKSTNPIIRKHQSAPVLATPAAFAGDYGTAYSNTRGAPFDLQIDNVASPMSADGIQPHHSADRLSSTGRRGKVEVSDMSSVASFDSISEHGSRQQLTFSRHQQQLLATPKQFVELVSKRLSEEKPKGMMKFRRSRVVSRVTSSSPTPVAYPQTWMRNGSLHVDDTLFEQTLNSRSPSLSPPGSPISAATFLHEPHHQRPPPAMPAIDLWDMIPAQPRISEPQLVNEASPEPLPAPMLRQSVMMDPPPSEFLDQTSTEYFETLKVDRADTDEWSDEASQDRLRKRKSEQEDKFDTRSLFTGSMSSGDGSVRRSRMGRKTWRRKSSSRSLMGSLNRSDHGRRPSSTSPRNPSSVSRSRSRDVSPDESRKKRMFQPDASGLFAEADIESPQSSDEEDDMLNEALMAFSTMKSLSLANEFPLMELPDELEYVASVRWRQLLANWKHHEMINILTSRPSSFHLTDPRIYDSDPTIEWSSSASTASVDFHFRKREKVLENKMILAPSTRNLNGMAPAYPFELQGLSRFTTHIGTPFAESSTPQQGMSSGIVEKAPMQVVDGDATVEQLLHMAGDMHGNFSRLIGRLAVFASQDYNPGETAEHEDLDNVSFSVDIKDARAIQRKADNKYGGDLLLVKDVLRAQVVFPTEGALVCAFAFLNQYCSFSSSVQPSASQVVLDVGIKAEIVRIKNLFAVSSTGQPCQVELPTGYRHILLNVRLDDGIVAEIQFHLAPFYHVLGEEGYHLHREILDANMEIPCAADYEPDGTTWDSTLSLLDAITRSHSNDNAQLQLRTRTSIARTSENLPAQVSNFVLSGGEDMGTAATPTAPEGSRSIGDANHNNNKKSPFAGGGIAAAAAAAAAAAKRDKDVDHEKPTSPFAGGGIAAAAAAAAASKKDKVSVTSNEKPKSPFAGGGIAAAAAAAAAAKKDKVSGTSNEKPKSPFAGGGIAAAAAAAAAAKKDKASGTSNEKPKSPFAGGGIAAAAAAAAAAKKDKASGTSNEKPKSPFAGGGIAAAAAAEAAAKRDKASESSNEKPKSAFAGGGIAAAAAAAAAAKRDKASDTSDEKPKSPSAGGGIAAAAAAAAAAKKDKDADHEKPKSPFAGGGIAAAAAAAAAAKRDKDADHEKPKSPFAGGGIAAAAAAAAAAKRDKASDTSNENPKSPFAGGGIAAAAAAAAAAKRDKHVDEEKPKSPFAGGGVAAAAAAAAAARRDKRVGVIDNETPKSSFGGEDIAAVGAAEALSNGDEVTGKGETSRLPLTDVNEDESSLNNTERLDLPLPGAGISTEIETSEEEDDEDDEDDQGKSEMAKKSFFIPGITGKARCLTSKGDVEPDDQKPASLSKREERRRASISVFDIDSTNLEEEDSDDSVEAKGAFFIPGITGKARCLKPGDERQNRISRPRSRDDLSPTRVPGVGELSGSSRSTLSPHAPRRNLSPRRSSETGVASRHGLSMSMSRSISTDGSTSTSSRPPPASSRRRMPNGDKLTNLSRYSSKGGHTGPYSRGTHARTLRRGSRHTLSEGSVDTDESGGHTMDPETYSKSASASTSFSLADSSDTSDLSDGDEDANETDEKGEGVASGDAKGDIDRVGTQDMDDSEMANAGTSELNEEDERKQKKMDKKAAKRAKKKAEKEKKRLGKKKSKYSELVDDDFVEDNDDTDLGGFQAIQEENSQNWESFRVDLSAPEGASTHGHMSSVDNVPGTSNRSKVLRLPGDALFEDHVEKLKDGDSTASSELMPPSLADFDNKSTITDTGENLPKQPFLGSDNASEGASDGDGGVAAAAARARKQQKLEAANAFEQSAGSSGIATADEMAAATQSFFSTLDDAGTNQKNETMSDNPLHMSLEEINPNEQSTNTTPEEKPKSPFPGGGIAAAADAAAAAKRSKNTAPEEKPKSPFAGGGIAAAAAAAAAAKHSKHSKHTDSHEKPKSPFAGGGIAAAAAAAAAAKQSKNAVAEEKPKSPFAGGGISAAAAAAATAKQSKNTATEEKPKSPFAGGGIAAAAAAAAAAKQSKNAVAEEKPKSPFAGGGIAAAAAAAAAAKQSKNTASEEKPKSPFAGGGIAAAAAAAAAAKQSKKTVVEEKPKSPFAGGGIAAAAAAAAAAKQSKNAETEEKSKSPFAGGGIAAAAAAAAAGKQSPYPATEEKPKSNGATFLMPLQDRSEAQEAQATTNDILLAVLTVALQRMKVESRDLASLHCVRVLCEYLSHLNGIMPPPLTSQAEFALNDVCTGKNERIGDKLQSQQNTTNFHSAGGGGVAALEVNGAAPVESISGAETQKSPFGGGGIAAAAAAAAAAKQSNNTVAEAKPKSPFAGGGIAAAAAAAAATKQSKNTAPEEKHKSPFAGGGIAAAAAAAAAAKRSKNTVPEEKPKSPFAGGGIAAAAAAAAAAKQSKNTDSDEKPKSPFAGGGIAAAAAAAAAAKRSKNTAPEEKPKSPFAGGGIAAAAAAAAAAKHTDSDEKPKSPFAGGGIAAAAAAAAAAKQSKNAVIEEKPKSPFAGGGIAAAAAAAAAAKQSKNAVAEEKPKSPFAGGGIAAAAAAAAAAKQSKNTATEGKPKLPFAGGGIAAAAAAAAAAKQSKNAVIEEKPKSPFAGGGIAAAAAAAAAAKQSKNAVAEEKPKSPFAGGGIAAAAAAAAAAKQSKNAVVEEKPKSPFAGGGIAAAAAAAAAAKQSKNAVAEEKPKSPFAGGGIAAAAAAAAAAKQSKNTATEEKPKSPFAGGGIAAAAAAAAAAKQSMNTATEEKPKSPFAGEGIAAAAAAAAAAKQSKNTGSEEKAKSPFAGRGIAAAAAAAAAAAKQKVSESTEGDAPFAGGGIAAAAARAAAQNLKMTTASLASPLINGGEMAVSAVQGASQGFASPTGDLGAKETLVAGNGIAAAAAQAAAQTMKQGAATISSPFAAGGGIAAAAARAAAAKLHGVNDSQEEKKESMPHAPARDNAGSTAKQDSGIAAAAAAAAEKQNHGFSGVDTAVVDASGLPANDITDQAADLKKITMAEMPSQGILTMQSNEVETSMNPEANLPLHLQQRFTSSRLDDKELLQSDLTSTVDGQTLNRLQEMTLLRSLSLSNQAMSVGMAGWLEYGSSNILDRSVDRAFEVMENLASLHAQQGRWTVAVDILRALVMKCEHHLPLYHPLTLVSMLDLAAALAEVSENEKAQKMSGRVLQRLALYLSEQEEIFLDARNDWLSMPPDRRVTFHKHSAADVVIMIADFVKVMLKLQKRDVLGLIKGDNSVLMLNYSVIADSLAVLANCASLNEVSRVQLLSMHDADFYWNLACQNYRCAFEGWSRTGQSLAHSNTSSLACGMARCLRETGQRSKGIRILTAVVTARKKEAARGVGLKTTTHFKRRKSVGGNNYKGLSEQQQASAITFLPPHARKQALSSRVWMNVNDEEINALCLWSLAIYRVEENPDERERIHALNLLHSSAKSLRNAIKDDDERGRANGSAAEMLLCVEEEARELFEPLKHSSKNLIKAGDGNPFDFSKTSVSSIRSRLEETARNIQGRFVSA